MEENNISKEVAEQVKGILPDANKVEGGTLSDSIDPTKSLEEATQDAESEMSVEDQQAILKQILQQSKQKSTMGFLKKASKQKSLNAEKKRKSKNKAQKKSRKINRKK